MPAAAELRKLLASQDPNEQQMTVLGISSNCPGCSLIATAIPLLIQALANPTPTCAPMPPRRLAASAAPQPRSKRPCKKPVETETLKVRAAAQGALKRLKM